MSGRWAKAGRCELELSLKVQSKHASLNRMQAKSSLAFGSDTELVREKAAGIHSVGVLLKQLSAVMLK
jgi:hypothetical protein